MKKSVINNGAFGSMKGVELIGNGRVINIDLPYYNNNPFGVISTISQVRIDDMYDLVMVEDPNRKSLSIDAEMRKWYMRCTNGILEKPAVIKMIKDGRVMTNYTASIIKVEDSKDYILQLRRVNHKTIVCS